MKNLTELIAKYGDKEIDENTFKELFDIKDSKVFIPKFGERYWCIDETGLVKTYSCEDDSVDIGIIGYNIVYRTRKEAEFERDAKEFKVKMKRDFAENSVEIDWDDITQEKHFQYLYYTNKVIGTGWTYAHRAEGTLYTTNKEWLLQYIEDNEADIKKYVFGIKEDE